MLPEEVEAVLLRWGEPKYRAKQVFEWIHKHGVRDPEGMTNLPKSLRSKLHETELMQALSVERHHESSDNTEKLVLELHDKQKIESVLIPSHNKPADAVEEIVTQCISSQAGCAMGCVFCASGVAGLKRQLSASEIIDQVLIGRSVLKPGQKLKRLVFMGMGEPLHNYDALCRALVVLMHPEGMNFSARRITVSTSGLAPQIDQLGKDFGGQIQLAISLHSTDNAVRSKLMPINRKHRIEQLLKSLREYPLAKRARYTIEYTLMAGYNDSLKDADALVRTLRGLPVKINLIPMNPIQGSILKAPDWDTVEAFQERLRERHLSVFMRKQRGDDIGAACGQLAFEGKVRKALEPWRQSVE
ncbi:MAG: 23S rRNA (adenine(2503)-C(2))-methyltransferase RlmN [Myxococcales bacterium]|nr:MAG: 23S rRNA (adenine(2503)-C(2))-methyltransferase RlmN [Myxococcales bacterium]